MEIEQLNSNVNEIDLTENVLDFLTAMCTFFKYALRFDDKQTKWRL